MYKRAPLEKRLRLRGGVWSFWGYDHAGKRYTASTHQTDRRAAIEAARQIERSRSLPPPDPTVDRAQRLTLAEALGLIVAHDKRSNASPNTIRFHIDRGRQLTRLLGEDTPCASITLPILNEYSDKRLAEKANRHTIQKEHRVLRQALALAKKNSAYVGEPKTLTVEGFDRAKGRRGFYRPGDTWLEHVEYIEALVAHTSRNPDKHRVDRRDDILAYVNLGLRRRELLVICPEHVDLRKAVVHVRELRKDDQVVRGLKTDAATRPLPLNEVMLEVFRRRVRGARAGVPLFTEWGSGNRDIKANWQSARAWLIAQATTAGERSDLDATLPKAINFNDLRRTFCSQMKNAGVSFEDCAELLGHEDIAMVRLVYGHTAMSRLHAAVAKLPAMTLPSPALPRPRTPSRRELQRQRAKARSGEVSGKPGGTGRESATGTDTVFDTNPLRNPTSEGAD